MTACVAADADATRACGARLAQALLDSNLVESPILVTLVGELGAGKTTFVAGLLAALGHEGPVRSPTYTLIEPYRLHVTLHHLGYHVDAREYIGQAASTAASRIAFAPFEMTLLTASSFAGREGNHPCVLLGPEERQPVPGLRRELSNQ